MCVAPTRAEAEDIAAAVTLDLDELPAVYDMRKAREPGHSLGVAEHRPPPPQLDETAALGFARINAAR